MDKLKALFRNRWFWRIVGAILLGLVIWFVGPLISIAGFAPFGWWPVTLFLALLPIILVGLFWLLGRRADKRKNQQMMDALKPDASDQNELAAKLGEALDLLKTLKLGKGRNYAYQLPWYAIVGPSRAGKTTALLNSGLNFPTAVAGEYRALRGQPNTPNCDWWFTDEAVLIDTAGRYVTQDVDAERDAAGWRSFLELLKKYRPLQPLNGVIVAIPATDFADPAKMASHAENVRARLAEIATTLKQDLPIYLLVTKADLLAGFREFFAQSSDDEANQVFGATAPGSGSDTEAVLKGFDALVTSVAARTVDRMQTEPQLPRRGQIAAFPAQLASLRTPIANLLAALGHKSRFDAAARLRGVYLASSIQTGNPVDRILLSVGQSATDSAHAVGKGRSFFLTRFFSDLVFPEQGMAGRNPTAVRRAERLYLGGAIASAVALVLLIGIWSWGYFRNSALIETVYTTASAYSQASGESRGGSASVEQDLASLGVLATATDDMDKASDFALGLGQGGRLEGELRGIYGRDLQRRLTPILKSLAEERMAANGEAPAALYDDLKSYLILGGQGPEHGEQLVSWVQSAWAARGNASSETEAGELARHTAALFDDSFKPVAIDEARVEAARTILRNELPAVRVYGRLKSMAMEERAPMWTAREHAGPSPELFFDGGGAFAPGVGIPAFFTRKGYDEVFLKTIQSGQTLLKEEEWVVGDSGQSLGSANPAALRSDLEGLYFSEFLSVWRNYLASIKLKPVASLEENMQRLTNGSGPLSPIKPLLRAIAAATDMTPSKGAAKAAGAMGAVLAPPTGLTGAMGAAGVNAAGINTGTGANPRGDAVAAFLPLRMFVGIPPAGGPPADAAPVDAMLGTMVQIAQKLSLIAVQTGGGGDAAAAQTTEIKALILGLDQSAGSMPVPANLWAHEAASDASVALGGARLAQMGEALNASFGDQCRQSLARSYPIQPAAMADLSLADFSSFFSPQGKFATFINQEVGSYIDRTTPSWKPKPDAGEVGLTEASVRALQNANMLTRLFFSSDPDMPHFSYQIEPVTLTGADTVTLTVDGQTLRYDGKSPIPVTFDWPGKGAAAIEFRTGDSSVPAVRAWPGSWAVFRMMKVAAVKAGASAAIGEGSLTQGGARFNFRVRTFSGANPFVIDPFVTVDCPAASSA